MPLNNPSGRLNITQGTYEGDATDNRAIPHGLGTTPTIIFVGYRSGADPDRSGFILYDTNNSDCRGYSHEGNQNPCTVPDDTNFYVPHFAGSVEFNLAATNYEWLAIG